MNRRISTFEKFIINEYALKGDWLKVENIDNDNFAVGWENDVFKFASNNSVIASLNKKQVKSLIEFLQKHSK